LGICPSSILAGPRAIPLAKRPALPSQSKIGSGRISLSP
jgi:hypothetical protein